MINRTAAHVGIVFCVSLGVRLAFQEYQTEGHITNDGFEYVNLARSLYFDSRYDSPGYGVPFLARSTAPSPDLLRPPLYPILVMCSYHIFGVTHVAAKMVCIVAGAFVPVVLYLLVHALTQSRPASLLAACLAAIHPDFLLWSIRPLTEQPYTLFILSCLLILVRRQCAATAILTALPLGLAFLTRYQAIIVVPVVLLHYFQRFGRQRAATYSALFVATFLVVITPWMLRNYSLTGNPIYGDHMHVGAIYSLGGGEVESFRRILTPTTERLSVLDVWKLDAAHKLRDAAGNVRTMMLDAPRQAGHPLVFSFAVLGALVSIRRSAEMDLLYLYVLASGSLIAATYVVSRFVQPIVPVYLVWASVGATWLYHRTIDWKFGRTFRLAHVVMGLVGAMVLLTGTRTINMVVSQKAAADEAEAVAFVRGATTKEDRIMAFQPARWAYYSKRAVLYFPLGGDEEAREFVTRYRVRNVIVAKADLERWNPKVWRDEEGPHWLELVYESARTRTKIYKVKFWQHESDGHKNTGSTGG